jgi:fructose-1,6-bisphosphatase I
MTGPLTLPADAPITAPRLAEFLTGWAGADPHRRALADLVAGIAAAARPLGLRLAQAALPGDPAAIVGTNDSGDRQKALDLAAHDHMIAALSRLSVHAVLSEEAEAVVPLSPAGRFDIAIDPIDGSGSIGIGAPLGLLYAVFPAGPDFLRPGRDVIAAGYVSFGHSLDMGFSLGEGLVMATLDPVSGQFHVTETGVTVPPETGVIAWNASNQRHWPEGLQRYAADLLAGRDGPRGRDVNMRWIAAAVGDLHRILRQGGVFLYPADRRPSHAEGRLRLLYEAFPIAFLIEQAGGSATDGAGPILDRRATSLHQHTPLIFGARGEVATLHSYLTQAPT